MLNVRRQAGRELGRQREVGVALAEGLLADGGRGLTAAGASRAVRDG